jgi:hypothetical protein
VTKGKFVLAKFQLKKKKAASVLYVGFVKEELPDGNQFIIKYLKEYNNRKSEFVFPPVTLKETVSDENIISVLPEPTCRRGKYTFPYDVI